MPSLNEIMANGWNVAGHHPWPRAIVDVAAWHAAIMHLHQGSWVLSSLWGEPSAVHMAVGDQETAQYAVLSLECPAGSFPSVGQVHPPAIRLERAIHDRFGLSAEGARDTRPWLDHGRWGVRFPLGSNEPNDAPLRYEFLRAEGESLHQVAVGPVHAGIIEPGHFRFTVNGETVVRLEERLGYAHKGIDALMAGADLERAAKLAGRVSGDSTVAYTIAFARAVEAALEIDAPPRAHWLRALMAELERLANHFGDIGAICNDASFALMHAHCGILRERVLRTADICFGHRLMQDGIVAGGVRVDLGERGGGAIRDLLEDVRRTFPPLVKLYDSTASLQDRTVNSGILKPALAKQFAVGGYVGRASGRAYDARRVFGYMPYNRLHFDVPILNEGDVNARVWIRIREVEQSLLLINQILAGLPQGELRRDVPLRAGEGVAVVEGFRGDILVWVRVDGTSRVVRCHMRDPSWFQWPLIEAVMEDNIVADFPLCNKSFNCSYSGHDL